MRFPDILSPRLLTGGGFGDVYVGTHAITRAPVAVKALREPDLDGARRAFAREAYILGLRLSRYIIPILGSDLDAPHPYYLMPFISGGTLAARAGRVSDIDLMAYAGQLAAGLASLHDADIAHGDVKPLNVLVDGTELRITDPLGNGGGCTVTFGTKIGGTPGYMAPELLRREAISPEGDVFALAASLFHVATGVTPANQPDLDPWRLRRSVHPDLREVILAAAHPIAQRRPTMASLQRSLARSHAVMVTRRNDVMFAVLVVLGVLLLAVVCLLAR